MAAAVGRSGREMATLFDVSVTSVVKWSQRQRATGSAAAKADDFSGSTIF
jgi:transposase